MKGAILFSICFLYSSALCAQSLVRDKIENYNAITFANYFHKNPYFNFHGDSVFLFNELSLTCAFKNSTIQTYDLEHLLSKENRKLIAKEYGFTYLFSEGLIVIQNKNNAFLFDYFKGKIKFKQRIKLSLNYTKKIYKIKNKLYFSGIYNYNAKDSDLPSGFLSYDLITGVEEIHRIPFECLSLTHFAPNNFIDLTATGYIVCNPLRYKLYEYDFNHVLKDSICVSDSLFTVSDVNLFTSSFKAESLSQHASNYLDKMVTHLQNIDRIWMVNYINDTTLFVRLTRNSVNKNAKSVELFFDHIWTKEHKTWKLVQVKEISSFNTFQTITEKELWPYFFPGSNYTCTNGILYYTVWSSSPNTFPRSAHEFFGFDSPDRNAISLKLIQFKVK